MADFTIGNQTIYLAADAILLGGPGFRKSFFAAGRHWVFYLLQADNHVYYKTSADNGATWSVATDVRLSATAGYMDNSSIWYDGAFGYYAISDGTHIYFRRFTPNSDGTITYSAAETLITTVAAGVFQPIISVSHGGHAWIMDCKNTGGGNSQIDVWRNDNTDGTWATSAGFPYAFQPSDIVVKIPAGIVPLIGEQMYAFAMIGSLFGYGRLYNAGWGAWEQIAAGNCWAQSLNGVADLAGNVYLTWINAATFETYARIRTFGVGLGVVTTIQAAVGAPNPTTTFYDAINNVPYIFRANLPAAKNIGWKKYSGGAWSGSWTLLVTDANGPTANSYLNCNYRNYTNKLNLQYKQSIANDDYNVTGTTKSGGCPDAGISRKLLAVGLI